ncbi:MAG: ABC transporter ATP-binding protein [Spirochaetales bacterium]|nr:ABC transporter ATP-binding protein [Spirochaetales bacterium]
MENEKIVKGWDSQIMKRLFKYVKPYKGWFILAIIGLTLATIGELLTPVVLQKAIDNHILLNFEDGIILKENAVAGLKASSFIYLGLLAGVLLFSFVQIYIMAFISQGVMKDMRMEVLAHTAKQPLGFLNMKPVGSLVSRVTSDVETVNELFTSVATSLLRDVFVMAGVIFVLFTLNTRLAFITLVSLPPVFFMTWFFRRRARNAYRRVRMWVSNVNGFLSEHISGMEVVQMFGREDRSRDEFGEKNDTLLKANLSEMYVFAVFRPMIDLFNSISTGVILYFGAKYFFDSSLSLGVLIAFVNLVGQFYRPVMDISEKFNILQSAMAGSERVFDLLDSKDALEDSGKDLQATGEVEFRDVRFSYNKDALVLKGLSFRIEPGETVAVVGYTGAGKTTIASLLARFWDIQGGEILLDGRNIMEYSLDSLRSQIQTVQQDVFLFSGTIEENITLGKDISKEELERAAATVQVDKFVRQFPNGYGTEVKEGGANLSAGQRQLISFARIIAHNPKVIILDEATASIDTETEKLIQIAMGELLKARTSLVIAHRLSTIRNADRILVLNEGVLVEAGAHDELMEKKGAYFNLYRLQYEDGSIGQV